MRILTIILAVAAAACHNGAVSAQRPSSGLPNVTEIDGDRVHAILRSDAIPSIDEPQFVQATKATFMRDDEPVVGIVRNGVAKAYSTWHLDRHEIVNDDVGGKAVSVTW